jgi:uncharacterized protein YhfF/two-component sensor histidine kinase
VSSQRQHTDADLLGEIAALREREAELETARAAAVEAADAERARIARNLHDGAQQQLVAVGQLVDLARRALDGSPERADELLGKAREQLTAANAELRELARGLHPVRLAEAGLAGALESLASASVLPVKITELPQRRLPDVIEASLYFLVAEAITNAGKYAQATKVVVSIGQQGPIVICEISDDGVGGASTAAGSGLAGLADRLAALGGTLKMTSPTGAGTRLHATLPVAGARTAREPFLLFGHKGDGGEGAQRIAAILEGRKRVSISIAREWELEGGLPRIGQQLPLIDQDGVRHGAVEVERVSVMPFHEVDTDVIAAERTEYPVTIEEWRQEVRDFYALRRETMARLFGEPDWDITPEEPLAAIWFRAVDG